MKIEKNQTINGLRGFAILLVFSLHALGGAITGGWFRLLEDVNLAESVWIWGGIGVEIFFMLTGYLMIGSLQRARSLKEFLVKRVVRIYPVFLVLHLFVFSVGIVLGEPEWFAGMSAAMLALNFVSNLLFLPGIFDLPIAQPVTWMMGFIFYSYIVAGCVHFLFRRGRRWGVMAALVLAAPVIAVVVHHPRSIFIGVGMVVCFLEQRFGRHELCFPGISLISVCSLAALAYCTFNLHQSYWATGWGGIFLISCLWGRGWWIRLLNWRFFTRFGTISYSFYLVHTFVMFPLKRIMALVPSILEHQLLGLLVFSLCSFALSYVISIFTHKYIEELAMQKILRL